MIPFTNPHRAGFLPVFFSLADPRPAVEQVHTSYAHGGGWCSFKGFTLHFVHNGDAELYYPGDPAMKEVSRAALRDETIILFEHDWVAVVQKDGSYDAAKID